MNLNEALAKALKQIRQTKGLTQEDFSFVSSRAYISTLERGLKSPTIEKLEQIFGEHRDTIYNDDGIVIIKVPEYKIDRATREIYLFTP